MSTEVTCLSVHAGYGCRRSGACCTAGWRIPVEPTTARALAAAVAAGDIPEHQLEHGEPLPVLPIAPSGACILFEAAGTRRPSACAAHRTLGHAAIPTSCRQFPRIARQDGRGIQLTLSHYCPTAAAMLFDTRPLTITSSHSFPADAEYEGLDAREALPPLLRPGLLMDLESYRAWEAAAVGCLADERSSAEGALAQIDGLVEGLRTWQPGATPLADHVHRVTGEYRRASAPPTRYQDAAAGYETAISTVPQALRRGVVPRAFGPADSEYVTSGWPEWAPVVRRFLAAKLYASWIAYQGRGLRTVAAAVRIALHVLRVESARACAGAGRSLDAELLTSAIRSADLLLAHEADSLELARVLAGVEHDRRSPRPEQSAKIDPWRRWISPASS